MKKKLFGVVYDTYGVKEVRFYIFGNKEQIEAILDSGELDDVFVTGERYTPELIEIGEFTEQEAIEYASKQGKILSIVYEDGTGVDKFPNWEW